jgi:Tfp pilus assembly protein PilF
VLSMRVMLAAILAAAILTACDSLKNSLFVSDAAAHARNDFLNGVKSYESGSYAKAEELLRDALRDGLISHYDQLKAHKYLAFISCSSSREMSCRSEFRMAFIIDPAFKLESEEEGNPYWGPVYRGVKSEFVHPNTNNPRP